MDPVLLTLLDAQLQQIVDEMDAMLSSRLGGRIGHAHALLHLATGEIQWQGRDVSPLAAGAMVAAAKRAIAKDGAGIADGGQAGSPCRRTLIRRWVGGTAAACVLASTIDRSDGRVATDLQELALHHGIWRLDALSAAYRVEPVREAIEALAERAAGALRGIIAGLPDGRWAADDWLDNDGVDDRTIRIALDLEIRGEQMALDFTRSSAAVGGPVNIDRATTIAACHAVLARVLGPLPAGAFAAVRVVVPDGSVLAGGPSAPSVAGAQTVLRVTDVVLSALAAAMPDAGQAPGLASMSEVRVQRGASDEGAMAGGFGGGPGACSGRDGESIGSSPFAELPSSELLEAAHPVLVATYALRPDSGGAGRYRGGLGAVYELEVRSSDAEASVLGDRGKYGPPGVRGGRPGAANRILWWDGGVQCDPPLVSKVDGLKLVQGQRLRLETPGGGGYGRARERDPAAVADDVRLGYVTTRAAEREYAVVVDADGVLDVEATRKLRGT